MSVTALLCDCLWRTAFFGTMNLDEDADDADISDEEIRKILAEADTGGTEDTGHAERAGLNICRFDNSD